MALNKAGLMAGILSALNKSQKKSSTASGNLALARGIAAAVDKYIKAGNVRTVVSVSSKTHKGAGKGKVT